MENNRSTHIPQQPYISPIKVSSIRSVIRQLLEANTHPWPTVPTEEECNNSVLDIDRQANSK